jgi:sulfopropanediol 3-dehydrogenase
MSVHYLKEPSPGGPIRQAEVQERVAGMLAAIEAGGLDVVRRYSLELDAWDPAALVLDEAGIARASAAVPDELQGHIAFAQAQIRRFAEAQRSTLADLEVEVGEGVVLGHRHIPVNRVGAYVPGGRYPMLASAFMTILVAKAAGVPLVIACAPPQREQGPHPVMVHAMATSGADAIVSLGGVQALAALSFGLIDGLPAVDMLVGAGNAYVAEAKRQLFGEVGIDLLAGPTEVLVIADETADPRIVAADLLGQAEHGPDSWAGLIATDAGLAAEVLDQVAALLPGWPTAEIAGPAWRDHGWVAVVEDHDAAIALADEVAAEHLEVQVDDAQLDRYLQGLTNYGSLFLGREATVAYGDKAVGTNHVLPTRRAARYTGGLWVGKFLKTVTWQRLSEDGTRRVAPAAAAISEAEGFGGHALTATMRLDRLAAADPLP